ncbi:hypothetical protein ACFS6H_03420 [Terrimonas rubra]|uniref:DUF2116 family Zn-ribbon domain-containing protein n=1 Tax=Terrimonas rubra TaxID=1035890 RepID=A0ABW6A2R0_9BACT
MLTQSTTACRQCGKTVKGRTDKRFCDDYCRSAFNNQLKTRLSKTVKAVNAVLLKNRKILEAFLPPGGDTIKTTRDKLLGQGFSFTYHTHSYLTKTGKNYVYCYEYGYLSLDNNWLLLVRRQEEAAG